MKLNDFENHPLWQRLRQSEALVAKMRAQDDGRNIDSIDELETRLAQLRAAHRTRRRLAPLVVPAQLDTVEANYQNVLNALNTAAGIEDRRQRAQYLGQAIVYAQAATVNQGAWSVPATTTVEERIEVAVVDALLERAGSVREQLDGRLKALEDELAAADAQAVQVTQAVSSSAQELKSLVEQATAAVDAEKTRIGTVIDEGNSTIAGFESVLERSLNEWQARKTEDFIDRIDELRVDQGRILDQAKEDLAQLQRTRDDHQALVQADSADRLAVHYEAEARAASTTGWRTTFVGFGLLIAASLPLLLVLFAPVLYELVGWTYSEPSWESLVARAGVTAVLVGAATVAIRMGSGYLKRSADYQRLAMEFRTLGPFLGAVEDRESVDQARLDLINRTFGQAYAPSKDDRPEDAVPVTVLQQLLALLTKTAAR